ncbi:hypothetical protein V5735_17295 (plasmid) [Haladaptatus sp. SPP-AMP-3]|uniref:hypothetical protein n=1 Tax=Haladaptatus sp. SPP-AMP-3 TaxID=3121295 RepID=UPI003C303628
MVTVLGYVLSIVIVLGCMFLLTLLSDKIFTDLNVLQSTPARISTDLLGGGVGFVIGVTIVTVISI